MEGQRRKEVQASLSNLVALENVGSWGKPCGDSYFALQKSVLVYTLKTHAQASEYFKFTQ